MVFDTVDIRMYTYINILIYTYLYIYFFPNIYIYIFINAAVNIYVFPLFLASPLLAPLSLQLFQESHEKSWEEVWFIWGNLVQRGYPAL